MTTRSSSLSGPGLTTVRTATCRRRLATQLDDEWATLRTRRRTLVAARRWRSAAGTHPLDAIIDGLTDLDHVLRATHRDSGRPGDDDAILLRLVELAQLDELACRLVVQRLLPGLVVRARPYRRPGADHDPLDALVAAACLAIGAYDTERRTRHVASSLLSDSLHHGIRKELRRRSATEVVRAPAEFVETAGDDEPSALVALAAAVREARRAGVTARDLELVRDLVAVGSPGRLAEIRNVTPRTIRNHRDRALEHMRAALCVAA